MVNLPRPNPSFERTSRIKPREAAGDRNFKRGFSGPWPGRCGHLTLAAQPSESGAARWAAQRLPRGPIGGVIYG